MQTEETKTEETSIALLPWLNAVAAGKDGAGSELPAIELPYFQRAFDKLSESDSGCWVWSGAVRGGSPVAKWPDYSFGAMVRRKVWRVVTGSDPGNGELALARRCQEKRCVRPDPSHVVLSPYRRGGGISGEGGIRSYASGSARDPNSVAQLVTTLHETAERLRRLGVRASITIG